MYFLYHFIRNIFHPLIARMGRCFFTYSNGATVI